MPWLTPPLIALRPAPPLLPLPAGSMPASPAACSGGPCWRGWLRLVLYLRLGSLVGPGCYRGKPAAGLAKGPRRAGADLRTSGVRRRTARPGPAHHRRRDAAGCPCCCWAFSASFAANWLTPAQLRSQSAGTHHGVEHQPAAGSGWHRGAISLEGTLASLWGQWCHGPAALGPGPGSLLGGGRWVVDPGGLAATLVESLDRAPLCRGAILAERTSLVNGLATLDRGATGSAGPCCCPSPATIRGGSALQLVLGA